MEEINEDLTPHELINRHYSLAARSISSLVELGKINPNLLEQVIELAIVIGINSAHTRIKRDERLTELSKSPSWITDIPKGY